MESDSIYSIATDSQNISTTSAAITLTVTASVTQIYYIHTDQLNTPRLITDSNNAKVWEWHNDDPFAGNVPNDDPNSTGSHFEYNPRLSGQYYDKETGLFYNWNRFYNPATGRYDQSDLIGLAAGVNTYAYVGGNPLRYTDPSGLAIAIPAICLLTPANLAACATAVAAAAKVVVEACKKLPDIIFNDGGKERDVPYNGPPGEWVDGERRSRKYGSDGKPEVDIDNPHPGMPDTHVHEWDHTKDYPREHPGRPVPW